MNADFYTEFFTVHDFEADVNRNMTPGALLRRAQQIVALKYDFEMEMSDLTSGRQGTLHVGGLRKGNLFLMPRLIRRFRMDYPGVDVILHEDTAENLEHALCAGELDLIYINHNRLILRI